MLGDLGDDGVSEGVEGVLHQPNGNPMSHSIQRGFRYPSTGPGSRIATTSSKLRPYPSRRDRKWTFTRDIVALGVGQKKHAVTCLWGTEATRRYNIPPDIEPELGKIAEDDRNCFSVAKQADHVLDDDVSGSNSGDDIAHPGPSPPLVPDTRTEAGIGERLAGRSTRDDVDGRSNSPSPPLSGGSDVVMSWHLRPVLSKDAAAVLVELHLADGGHPSPLQTELKATDSSEQG